MNRFFVSIPLALLVSLLFGLFSLAGAQNVDVQVFTDKPLYNVGQSMSVSLAIDNPGGDIPVDVHIAVIAPNDGADGIYEWPDWNTDFQPALSNWTLPGGWNLPKTELFTVPVTTSEAPFLAGEGTYLLVVAFMEANSFTPVREIGERYFNIALSSSDQESVGGVFLGWMQDFDEGGTIDVTAVAAFMKNLQATSQFNFDVPSLEMDTCEVFSWSYDIDQGINLNLPTFLDAGSQVTMTGAPEGAIVLPKFSEFGVISYTKELTDSSYQEGESYSFIGPGGPDVGAFETSLNAPAKVTLISPDLQVPVTIDRSKNLDLQWENPTADSEIWVSITTTDFDFSTFQSTYYECQCRFKDDGQATIPSDKLSQLPLGTSQLFGQDLNQSSIDVTRTKWTSFGASGLDYGLEVIGTGACKDINLK